MNLSKRLAKEREEMGRELRRLHENTLDLHDKMIMQIQVLKTDDKPMEIIEACNHLHEKWQQHSRQYYHASTLNEAEQKLWMAEESWRKSKSGGSASSSSGPSSLQDQQSYAQRNLRDRLEDMKGRTLALPSASRLAALASSDDEADDSNQTIEEASNEYEDLETKSERKIRTNIAQRKKLATPSPSHHGGADGSRASLDESLYSSLSNEVYSKIQSPPPPLMKSGLISAESGTASVIEVIEPTAAEEEEFKQAFKEMNWLGSFPREAMSRDAMRSSMMTTASASPMMTSRHHARPIQVRSPTLSKTSRDSYGSRYSSSGELSPTKRLLEMGIHTSSIDNAEAPPMLNDFNKTESRSSSRISKKISPVQMYANLNHHDGPVADHHQQHQHLKANLLDNGSGPDHEVVEEHVLPDNFDEEPVVLEPVNKSSVSPASRKSASSHTSKGSEDSGIGIPINKAKMTSNNNNVEPKFKVCNEEAAVVSVKKASRKRESMSSKAWYDVPSDDDTEAPEADSLASIISHRGSSDEEQ